MPRSAPPETAPQTVAARVLRTEAQGLLHLAEHLPPDFPHAVALILACEGRVVLAGMGKSGHIARKIAATLASTGTPAFFVHPAEASHGDLGMITPKDICLLLSNSGETAELGDVLAHCARFSIPIIGLSKAPESSLMRAATLHLTLPDLPEACAIGMAPTTSTAMMLGLGDALAVALMEKRQFREEEFRSFHPGGKLGARLAQVHQMMHGREAVPVLPESATMQETILKMTACGFGIAGIVDDDGRLIGVISDGDLRRNMPGLLERRAGEVANRNPVTVGPETLAAEALAVMSRTKIGALFVVQDDSPIGILHLHDLLRAGVA
jgi:arabinose-5-phosphate isomerase